MPFRTPGTPIWSRAPTVLVDGGTRSPPRGMTPGFHVLGRETFLAPVEWVAGWPLVVGLDLEMHQAPSGASEPMSLERSRRF